MQIRLIRNENEKWARDSEQKAKRLAEWLEKIFQSHED